MAEICQKNNKVLPQKPNNEVDSKEDLFSKSTKLQSLSELKFPGASDESKYAKAESLEKSLNDASGTAIKVGLKGLVALSKAQQQLEDRSSQRAMRMQNNMAKPKEQNDPLANLLAIFSMIKSSAIAKKFSKLFSKRIKQNTETQNPDEQLEIEEIIAEHEREFDRLEEKPQR